MQETFETYGIKVPVSASGNVKTICPACTPHNRKPAHKNNKDLSVNIPQGVWNCHNCGWTGNLKQKEEKKYVRPVEITLPMSQRAIEWFKGRGIKENTLKFFGITEKMEWMPQEQKEANCILFPYRKNKQWVNVKFRDAKKNFKLTKDAELLIFNYDAVMGKKRVCITEGEIDAMSLHESGFLEVCSVPNGASKGSQRLEYIDNSWQAFSEADEILIATDSDEAGIALKNELSRRLGRDRCLEVHYPDGCKDFNEVLIRHGQSEVWNCINRAKPFPLQGILRLSDFAFELDNLYDNGFQPGAKVGYSDFDELINFSTGQLTVVTGVPNSGKSAFVDQLLLKFAQVHEWNIGICSFENQPFTRHAANLLACHVGKPFHKRYTAERMSLDEYGQAKEFLYKYFFWFKMKDEDLTCAGILERGKQLVKTHGIKALVIDPYNYMEHKRSGNQNETEYISELLTMICNFAKDYDVHVFLVAHPTKIKKNPVTKDFEVPNLYDIAGSANFFNKTDNGITVYRDRKTNLVTVHVQKVRFNYNGKIGSADFTYDPNSGRYTPVGEIPNELPKPERPYAGFTRDYTEPSKEQDLPF